MERGCDQVYVSGMAANSKVTVLIMHDNPLLSAGLAAAFRGDDEFEVIPGSTPPAASAAVVVIADFDNGVRLLTAGLTHPVMIVSHEDGEMAIRQALASGVRGYLLLGSPIASILNGARTIVRGGFVIDPFAASQMLNSLNAERLTKRELDVLGLLMRGLSDKVIASRLGAAAGTIKCHVRQLRKKLKAKSRTEAVLIAQKRGLLAREPSPRTAVQSLPIELSPASTPSIDSAGQRPHLLRTAFLQA